MKKITLLFFAIVTLLSVSAFKQVGESFKSIGAQEFKSLLAEKKGVLIDVRTAIEMGRGKIANAQNIDWFSDDFQTKINSLDKNQAVFIYCAVGGRSLKAMEKLKAAGFKEVYNLNGGIKAWEAAGFAVQ